jgi:FemAB family protein
MISEIVSSRLAALGVRSSFREASSEVWDKTLARLSFAPVPYSQHELNYQLAYIKGGGVECEDISLVLFHDNRPCGIWPLCYAQHKEGAVLSSYLHYGQLMLPPLFVAGLAEKTKKALTKRCIDLIEALCKDLHILEWHSAEPFNAEIGLSNWYEESLIRGGSSTLRHELFVDLSPSMIDIKSKFRKSYKSLVTEGMRIWQVGVLSDANTALWESFRILHQKIAGKTTRSLETWNLQYQAIVQNQAFLVHLHNAGGELVGGGYFSVTRDQGVYNVGAYDRTLFEQPLGHVVQYKAIEEMKARGVRWYKIGLRRYPSQEKDITEKLIAIGDFMGGFSSHLFPKFVIRHNVEPVCS